MVKFIQVASATGEPLWYNANEIVMMADNAQGRATLWMRDGSVLEWADNVQRLLLVLENTQTTVNIPFTYVAQDTSTNTNMLTYYNFSTLR